MTEPGIWAATQNNRKAAMRTGPEGDFRGKNDSDIMLAPQREQERGFRGEWGVGGGYLELGVVVHPPEGG